MLSDQHHCWFVLFLTICVGKTYFVVTDREGQAFMEINHLQAGEYFALALLCVIADFTFASNWKPRALSPWWFLQGKGFMLSNHCFTQFVRWWEGRHEFGLHTIPMIQSRSYASSRMDEFRKVEWKWRRRILRSWKMSQAFWNSYGVGWYKSLILLQIKKRAFAMTTSSGCALDFLVASNIKFTADWC